MHKLRINDVAERTGFTVKTAREYVRLGILPPPRERIGVVMLFSADDITAFQTFRRAARRKKRSRR